MVIMTSSPDDRINTIEAELKHLLMKGGGRRIHELPSELMILNEGIKMIRSVGYNKERMERIERAFSKIKEILS